MSVDNNCARGLPTKGLGFVLSRGNSASITGLNRAKVYPEARCICLSWRGIGENRSAAHRLVVTMTLEIKS